MSTQSMHALDARDGVGRIVLAFCCSQLWPGVIGESCGYAGL